MFPFRIGSGYDVHELREGFPLRLGGVEIEHTKGAVGYSDADALLHAVCDALLGAAGLPDIGQQFPDNAAEFKGMDSKILLGRTFTLIQNNGWEIGNLDCIIILQRPKIAGYIPSMIAEVSRILKVDASLVSIKATTTEKLGFEGREEGVAAWASVLIHKKQKV
ncbi:MAG: 2-C-methyl-D-erythritol 2,4-cyclodiphosphate synthase [Lentimicrobium sp.]|jgi:2-C-methyl-D-erythritol 2,4-cyclodiphosphate synthase|nr:2-C-methyl-D-erythritol 2,4-cyclodiphosphate synthase [Lentimicrobium sp.]MDD2527787.1 2-C-methyl-D-erythritol 2,4-cyclodiphosphate synthase [Lentimicrobiaceae bacterium]MDD4598266.1 2-C-methyl-D-erythritol 2,4-cyclodiphosphate synthase [Lentimicrobiaceae bacterium]MDY0025716.1 2-C-methyl-D-erythritol 2,4-cyclodiphosphate synthase [Lentimicrobium sp.]HAH59539.1 2-C-methyl-D-erythritol 2,4-cyclodiphosphate synthase [Bacteroidales bacterium]